MPYNLFIDHHTKLQKNKGKIGIGTGWEDDFTNMLSFYLSCDREALISFCQLVLGEEYEEPISIETQFVSLHGRPDIMINLSSGTQLIIECKVDASLQPYQLQRYLKIKSKNESKTFVALFCKYSTQLPNTVFQNRRYKTPVHGSHFFWSNLFKILPKPSENRIGIDAFRLLFRNYMELIGFAPSSLKDNWTKLYEDRTIAENKKVHELFGQNLSGIRAWLENKHFKVTAVSQSGLQAVPKAGQLEKSGIRHITISPERARKDLLSSKALKTINNEVLRIALVFDLPEIPDSALGIYNEFPCPFEDQNANQWWATKPYKFPIKRVRLEFVANLSGFLSNVFEIKKALSDSCISVLEIIYKIIEN